MNKYLADTTVLIEHLRGNENAKQFLVENNPSISTVTIAELIQGARDKQELPVINKLTDNLSEIRLDNKISQKTIELLQMYYLSHGLLFLDALIGATAIEKKLTLVTGNVKHFKYIPELEVLSQEDAFAL